MIKEKKERKPAEESLFLRMLWIAQVFTCFYLVAMVDPQTAFFSFVGLKIPLLLFDFWVAVVGLFLSYHYRHVEVKWLEYLGLLTIIVCCSWFVDNLHHQLATGDDIDILLPTVQLLAGLFVSHSFELRSRFDFNFSLVLSFILVCFTATIGKGAWFGLGMFVYVILAATLLLLDCEARTFGSVQARGIDGADTYLTVDRSGNSEKTANLIFPTSALLALSIMFFLVAPRAESLADQVSAQIYSIIKNKLHPPPFKPLVNRVRTPYVPPRPEHKQSQEKGAGESGTKDKDAGQKESTKADAGQSRAAVNDGAGTNAKDGGVKKGAGKDKGTRPGADAKKDKYSRAPYSRKLEKEKLSKKSVGTNDSPPASSSSSSFGSGSRSSSGSASPGSASSGSASSRSGSSSGSASSGSASSGSASSGGNLKQDSGSGRQPEAGSTSKTGAGRKGTSEANGANGENGKQKRNTSAGQKNPNASSNDTGHGKNESKQGKTPSAKDVNDLKKLDAKAKESAVYYMPDSLDTNAVQPDEDMVIFNVSCNRTVFFRQGAFDNYDGKMWQISPDLGHSKLPHAESGAYILNEIFPLALPSSVPAIRLKQKFHVQKNLGLKLIFAGSPYEITYSGPSIDIDTCGNLKGGWALVKGLEYTVVSDEPMYNLKSMRAEGVPDDDYESRMRTSLGKFMQIPDNQSDELVELSREVAGVQENWFVQAEKICNYLRKNYKYSAASSVKKEAQNAVDRFLFKTKAGDCKDFASAFVILCRASGIPARMVVGFTPGEFDPSSGTREIRLKNSHAWGEIFFPSCGWVPFDATPTGTMPGREGEEERYFTTVGEKVEQSIKGMEQTGAVASTNGKGGFKFKLQNGKTIEVVINLWDLLKGVPFVLGALVVWGPITIFFKDVFKNIRLPARMHPASKIYMRVIKDLKPVGISYTDSQTSGEFLDRLNDKLNESNDPQMANGLSRAVEDFISTYNAVYFGGRGSTKDLEEKRTRIKELIKR